MIPFRATLRAGFLSTAGRLARPSNSIHLLSGHVLGRPGRAGRARFRTLLRQLSETGTLVRIEDACAMIASRTVVARPHIGFTFDDGYQDCHAGIAPVLEEFGINAAFFINPGFVRGDQRYIDQFWRTKVPNLRRRVPMKPAQLANLAARGFIIGAHTMSHERLVGDDPAFLQEQVVDCRGAVEALSGQPCEYFAWAYGLYNDISGPALDLAIGTYQYVFSSDRYADYTCRGGAVMNRRHFECDWPLSHVRYFLSPTRRFEALAAAAPSR